MIALALWASPALAGAWTRDLGSAYVKAGADAYQALSFQAPGESERSDGAYLGQQYSVYGEVGVSPGHPIQIAVAVPMITVGSHRTQIIDAFGELPVRATSVRPGDLRVWAQTALHRRLPIAAAIEVKIPMYANGMVGARLPNYEELFPKPGDGQIDVTAWVHAGTPLGKRGFVEGAAGYLFRTEAFVGWDTTIQFNDGVRALGKVGTQVGSVLLIVGLEAQLAWSKTNAAGDADLYSRQFVVASGNALLDVGGGFAIEPRLAVELYARNASQGWGGGLGVSWRK